MSRWTDAYKNLQLTATLEKSLDALANVNREALDPAQWPDLDRAIKLATNLKAKFSEVDPEMVPENSFSNVAHNISQVQNFALTLGKPNFQNLPHLNNALDQASANIRTCLWPQSPADITGLTEANAIYQKQLIEGLDVVRKQVDEIKKQFTLLSSEFAQDRKKLAETDGVIQQQKTRIDGFISEFQKQFSSAQESRNQEFTRVTNANSADCATRMQKIEESFVVTESGRQREWVTIRDTATQQAAEHLKHLKTRKEEADKLFGAFGAEILAGNFNEIANTERSSADRWRRVAIAILGLMGAVALVAFCLTFKANPDWETFVFRIGTAAILSVPAFYAANESSKHREREKLIRKNFLELSAIDAYLVHLPDDERNQIKAKLSEKFFGVPEILEKSDNLTKKDLFGLIENLVKAWSKGH